MLKFETRDLVAIGLYNDLVVTLEEIRREDYFLSDAIEGYTLAREMVEHFFARKLISEQKYYKLDCWLHYCVDCPSTHCVQLDNLQLDISLT